MSSIILNDRISEYTCVVQYWEFFFAHFFLKPFFLVLLVPFVPFVFDLFQTRDSPLLIVLEDLHLVFDAEWVSPFFSRLLPLLPPDVHLLITCRSLLPTPLWRMRSKQQLCLIEEEALHFTFEEARLLCKSQGLSDFVAGLALKESRGKASTLNSIVNLFRHQSRETRDNNLRRCLNSASA